MFEVISRNLAALNFFSPVYDVGLGSGWTSSFTLDPRVNYFQDVFFAPGGSLAYPGSLSAFLNLLQFSAISPSTMSLPEPSTYLILGSLIGVSILALRLKTKKAVS